MNCHYASEIIEAMKKIFLKMFSIIQKN